MSILTILQRQKFLDGGRGNLVQGFLQILLEELRKERENSLANLTLSLPVKSTLDATIELAAYV